MFSDNFNGFTFLLISIVAELVTGDSIKNVENVLNNIFSPAVYNREIRGKLDQKQTLDVNLGFALVYIKSLNEIEETIEAFGVLFIEWEDERLIWDPTAYNGTDRVYITAGRIWHPEITLENPSKPNNFYGDVTRLLSIHKSNGVASLLIGDLFECSCSIDLTSFPWDKQECDIVFVVWGYLAKEVRLVAAQKYINLQNYQSNGVWTLLSTKVYSKPNPQKSLLAFQVVLQRRPLFFIINILLPIVTLSVLELFVFIVPIDSGERISFSLTVLLSIAVFITLISDNLPSNSETMASICYLLVFILIESAFICLFNIFSVKLYLRRNENYKISTFWCKFVHIFGRGKCCRRSEGVDIRPDVSDKDDDCDDKDSVTKIDISKTLKEKTLSWQEVSKTFDRVVSILMTFLLCSAFLMYVYYVTTGIPVTE